MLEQEILSDSAQSEWLRSALRTAMVCDAVRAANDAELLACVLRQRAVRAVEVDELVNAIARPQPLEHSLSLELPVTSLESAGSAG